MAKVIDIPTRAMRKRRADDALFVSFSKRLDESIDRMGGSSFRVDSSHATPMMLATVRKIKAMTDEEVERCLKKIYRGR